MIIPFDSLEKDVLKNVLEDIVTRDGTDYGEAELTMQEKTDNLRVQLQLKNAYLIFDETTETISVVEKEDARRQGLLDSEASL